MKLVIQTQIRENYGAHDWDGNGECPQRWKFKGGTTYVVNDLSSNNINRYNEMGIPKLSKLVEESNEYFQEYVLQHSLEEDDAKICDDWETPTELVWGGDRWLASKTVDNNEYNWMRKDILKKREEWIPQEGGERAHYKLQYLLPEGWVNHEKLEVA